MRQGISGDIGFTVTGRIQIYETEPAEPPEKSRADTIFSLHLFAPTMTNRPDHAMERTAALRNKLRVFATAPCRGLSLSR
jgi:hypothetical protein